MNKIARGEGNEVRVRLLLNENGVNTQQGGRGPADNRREGDIHAGDVALEVQFADRGERNVKFTIGKEKVRLFSPSGRTGYFLFGNDNIGRYAIVESSKLRFLLDDVSNGHSEYCGVKDKGQWYLIDPEFLSGICLCESQSLEDLIRMFSKYLKDVRWS